jgi:DNA primase
MGEMFVDFRIVKQQVTMEMVLGHYNIELRRSNKTSLRGKCPLPIHSSEKSKESFGVHIEKNIWACQSNSCAQSRQGKKGGNVIDFVSMMESCSVRDAALKLKSWFLLEPNSATSEQGREQTEKALLEKNVASESATECEVNKPLSFTLKDVNCSHPYIAHRGITEEVAKKFGVGLFPGRGSMSGRVVIPISNERGDLIAYAGRSIDGSDPKYKLPTGFAKSKVLFNLNRVLSEKNSPVENKLVIVVEGFIDCIKVHQAGLSNVVALMGSSMSEEQQKLLSQFQKVIIFLDGDDAGRGGAQEIAMRLMQLTFVRIMDLPDGKQPDQLSSEEIKSILAPAL